MPARPPPQVEDLGAGLVSGLPVHCHRRNESLATQQWEAYQQRRAHKGTPWPPATAWAPLDASDRTRVPQHLKRHIDAKQWQAPHAHGQDGEKKPLPTPVADEEAAKHYDEAQHGAGLAGWHEQAIHMAIARQLYLNRDVSPHCGAWRPLKARCSYSALFDSQRYCRKVQVLLPGGWRIEYNLAYCRATEETWVPRRTLLAYPDEALAPLWRPDHRAPFVEKIHYAVYEGRLERSQAELHRQAARKMAEKAERSAQNRHRAEWQAQARAEQMQQEEPGAAWSSQGWH